MYLLQIFLSIFVVARTEFSILVDSKDIKIYPRFGSLRGQWDNLWELQMFCHNAANLEVLRKFRDKFVSINVSLNLNRLIFFN